MFLKSVVTLLMTPMITLSGQADAAPALVGKNRFSSEAKTLIYREQSIKEAHLTYGTGRNGEERLVSLERAERMASDSRSATIYQTVINDNDSVTAFEFNRQLFPDRKDVGVNFQGEELTNRTMTAAYHGRWVSDQVLVMNKTYDSYGLLPVTRSEIIGYVKTAGGTQTVKVNEIVKMPGLFTTVDVGLYNSPKRLLIYVEEPERKAVMFYRGEFEAGHDIVDYKVDSFAKKLMVREANGTETHYDIVRHGSGETPTLSFKRLKAETKTFDLAQYNVRKRELPSSEVIKPYEGGFGEAATK